MWKDDDDDDEKEDDEDDEEEAKESRSDGWRPRLGSAAEVEP